MNKKTNMYSMIKYIMLMIISSVILTGCLTGKNAAEKREKFVSDSLKYEAVKDAFTKGGFVFKISRIDGKSVNASDNWLLFSNGRVRYQTAGSSRMRQPYSKMGDLTDMDISYNLKNKTITMTGDARKILQTFTITFFEGSDKADGYIEPIESTGKVSYNMKHIEGWIEPLNEANIVRGWESPIYK